MALQLAQALCIISSYRIMNILSAYQVVSAPGGNHKFTTSWCTFFNQFTCNQNVYTYINPPWVKPYL